MSVAPATPTAPAAQRRDESLASVLAPLAANTAIAVAKGTAAALTLDAVSGVVAVRTLRRQAARRHVSVSRLLRETPDPTVVTVYLEDSIDVLGAALALVALILHRVTGSALPDALATLVIGLMLGYVALRLTGRNRELLTNQAVPERYVEAFRRRLVEMPGIASVPSVQAVYLGPGEVLVTADVTLEHCQDAAAVSAAIERARTEIRRDVPAIAQLALTP